jgi:hypothetical protein
MFDRNLMRSNVDRATQVQRETIAFLCLARVGAVRENEATRAVAGAFPRLIDDVLAALRSRISGEAPSAPLDGFPALFEGILGPQEGPFKEPHGVLAWVFDVTSLADYAVRTFTQRTDSSSVCFNVLLASYSFAGMLERGPRAPSPNPLRDLEVECQIADFDALFGAGLEVPQQVFESRSSRSAELGEIYAGRFEAVVSELAAGAG